MGGRWRAVLLLLATVAGVFIGAGTASAAAPGYVALGDSYSSGVGTRAYINDGSGCMRSVYAYPELITNSVHASLSFQACSGAATSDVLGKQLGTLSASTAYVTITVGGNDAGFSSVIERCAEPWPVTCTSQVAAAQSFIRNTLPGRLDTVYNAIRSRAPHARVVVVGYPRLFEGKTCNLLARISLSEEASLNTTADILATTTQSRAAAHGFTFVDSRNAFSSHEICAGVEWLNGLSDPVTESYHPNRGGQIGFAGLIQPALLG